jgi:hypothetical protein
MKNSKNSLHPHKKITSAYYIMCSMGNKFNRRIVIGKIERGFYF